MFILEGSRYAVQLEASIIVTGLPDPVIHYSISIGFIYTVFILEGSKFAVQLEASILVTVLPDPKGHLHFSPNIHNIYNCYTIFLDSKK